MRAISLWQPWATLVATQEKLIETRSWSTSYRGLIAIHAAKRWTADLKSICKQEPFKPLLQAHGYLIDRSLPLGAFVAVAELVEVHRTEEISGQLSDQERAFGNYSQGRFAWILRNIQAIDPPIPALGRQSLWLVEEQSVGRDEMVKLLKVAGRVVVAGEVDKLIGGAYG